MISNMISGGLLVGLCLSFFFFQAEDGIRDLYVTGVQTCALPISSAQDEPARRLEPRKDGPWFGLTLPPKANSAPAVKVGPRAPRPASGDAAPEFRSEERRVGKECRSRWSQGD